MARTAAKRKISEVDGTLDVDSFVDNDRHSEASYTEDVDRNPEDAPETNTVPSPVEQEETSVVPIEPAAKKIKKPEEADDTYVVRRALTSGTSFPMLSATDVAHANGVVRDIPKVGKELRMKIVANGTREDKFRKLHLSSMCPTLIKKITVEVKPLPAKVAQECESKPKKILPHYIMDYFDKTKKMIVPSYTEVTIVLQIDGIDDVPAEMLKENIEGYRTLQNGIISALAATMDRGVHKGDVADRMVIWREKKDYPTPVIYVTVQSVFNYAKITCDHPEDPTKAMNVPISKFADWAELRQSIPVLRHTIDPESVVCVSNQTIPWAVKFAAVSLHVERPSATPQDYQSDILGDKTEVVEYCDF